MESLIVEGGIHIQWQRDWVHVLLSLGEEDHGRRSFQEGCALVEGELVASVGRELADGEQSVWEARDIESIV